MTAGQDIVDQIVDYLFSNGAGQEAKRLVIELADGSDGGGWCKEAVRDAILDRLHRQFAPYPQPKPTPERNSQT